MGKILKILFKIKEFLLDIFFPKFCFGCKKEGTYLCQDCLALIDISEKVLNQEKELSKLYFATDYENFLVKSLIWSFKYEPFVKDLAETLTSLIINYFKNLEKKPEFLNKRENFILLPIPLHKKRLRWRGFNQAEEMAKILSKFLKIPFYPNVLIKIKETPPQLNLPEKIRKENVKGVFICKNPEIVRGKNVLLVDDVFTTGSTMEEAAKILKKAGAQKTWGIVVAKE